MSRSSTLARAFWLPCLLLLTLAFQVYRLVADRPEVSPRIVVQSLHKGGGNDAITTQAFTHDGELVATGGNDGTVRLWNARSKRLIRVVALHRKNVLALSFSDDDRMLVAALERRSSSDGNVAVVDVDSGAIVREFDRSGEVERVGFSRDGRLVYASSASTPASAWRIASGAAVADPGELAAAAAALANAAAPLPAPGLSGQTLSVTALASSNRSDVIALASSDRSIAFWNVRNGDVAYQPTASVVRSLAFSHNGRHLVAGQQDGSVALFQPDSAAVGASLQHREAETMPDGFWGQLFSPFVALAKQLFVDPGAVLTVAVANDGRTVASGGDDNVVNVFAVDQKGRKLKLDRFGRDVKAIAFSPDEKTLAVAAGSLELFDTRSGASLAKPEMNAHCSGLYCTTDALAFSNDGQEILSGGNDDSARRWDARTAREIGVFRGHDDYVGSHLTAVAFSVDGRLAATASTDGTAVVWSVALQKQYGIENRPLYRLVGHETDVLSVAFAQDGKALVTAGQDGTVKLWRATDGAPLATYYPLAQGNWLIVTPEGYFNTSSFDAANYINVVVGRQGYPISDFWEVFYRPDLVRKKIAGDDISGDIGGVTFASVRKYPAPGKVNFRIRQADPAALEQVTLDWDIKPLAGGVGEVRVFQNGKLIYSDGQYAIAEPVGGSALLRAPAKDCDPCTGSIEASLIPGEDNEFSLIAFNRDNTVQSFPFKVNVVSQRAKKTARLWVLATGINKFGRAAGDSGSSLSDLVNARKDATDFLCTLVGGVALKAAGATCGERGVAPGLFGGENIRVLPALYDDDATRGNILAALARVASEAQPWDTFVWFSATHGLIDRHGAYALAPRDLVCQDSACREFTGELSANDILASIKKIRAMNQLVILDTCHAGALDQRISGLYDARISGLAKNMGLHIYASAQATELANDGSPNANGVFTGQLLRGLKDARADRDRDGFTSVVELGNYVKQATMSATLPGVSRGAKRVEVQQQIDKAPSRPLQTPVVMHFGLDAPISRSGAK